MSHRSNPIARWTRFAGALALLSLVAGVQQSSAQSAAGAALSVDKQRSLVWWQIDPHFGHLWASSCPKDPSWQPGEGHSAGHYLNYAARPRISTNKASEERIPLFPRRTVRPNCRQAISGTFSVADANRWTGFKGTITVRPDSIDTGADFRNDFAKKYVYSTNSHPTITFAIDSLTQVTIAGDTVNAVAVGTFQLRGVQKLTRVQVRGVRETSGMRVRGMFAMPSHELRDRYGVSQWALGAGVGLKLWDTLFMGFDFILTPTDGASAGT
jgi:hypothetical protein